MIATETAPALRTCPLCGSPVRESFLYSHVQTDLDVLTELKRRNPAWVQVDGSCPKGLDELRTSRHAARQFKHN